MNRIIQNLITTRFALKRAFPEPVLDAIEQAIQTSEQQHSGEIRFAIETSLNLPTLLRDQSVRDRAIEVFSDLQVWDTRANNGVLIYLLLAEKDIEIVADCGFNEQVDAAEWQQVCSSMEQAFAEKRFKEGAVLGIEQVTTLISQYYPPQDGDENELPDRPIVT
jgi:uncharacterized membrane protein